MPLVKQMNEDWSGIAGTSGATKASTGAGAAAGGAASGGGATIGMYIEAPALVGMYIDVIGCTIMVVVGGSPAIANCSK
jgi:hypothetical protein